MGIDIKGKYYRVRHTIKKQLHEHLFLDEEQAVIFNHRMEKVKKGLMELNQALELVRPGETYTVAKLIEAYLTDRLSEGKPKDWQGKLKLLNKWVEWEGKKNLNTFTAKDLNERKHIYLNTINPILKRKPKPNTWNRYISALSSVFTWGQRRQAIGLDPWFKFPALANPAKLLGFAEGQITERRALTNIEIYEVVKEARKADPITYCLIVLGLSYGRRLGEYMQLTKNDINLETGTITFKKERTKTGSTTLVLSLTPTVIEALTFLPQRKDDLLIGKVVNFTKRWRRIYDRCGLPQELTFHSLRHTVASQLLQEFDIMVVKKILGHTLGGRDVTARYVHIADKTSVDACNYLEREFFRPEQKNNVIKLRA